MSIPLSALPSCVALRSKQDNNSYLQSVHDESLGGSLIELGGDGGSVMNPRCRFYLEPSKDHEGLMHVRCCYNNKYWVPQERVLHGSSARWVIGTADEPEEDLSKPSCTLHKLIVIAGEQAEEDGSTCKFLHSKLGKYVCAKSTSIRYMHIVSHEDEADRQDGGLIDAFTVIDVSDQKQLPSYLAFKGDNEHFLVATQVPGIGKTNFLEFKGGDIGDLRALHTIFTNHDGVVRIKSNYFGKFWRRNATNLVDLEKKLILAESDDTTHKDPNTLFRVTTGDDFIALQSLGNHNFCQRSDGIIGSFTLGADAHSIITRARLQCYEPVISRDIYDVDFRLSEARMYTKGINGLHSQTVKNKTSTTQNNTLTFTYTHTVATTWSSTVSLKIGIKTTLVTKVPFFAEGSIEFSTEFSGSYTWGKTETKQEGVTKKIDVSVLPMKKVTVKAFGSNGVCDIPFSYKQKDVLTNGQVVIQEFTDGIYFGVKTSYVTFEIDEEDLRVDED